MVSLKTCVRFSVLLLRRPNPAALLYVIENISGFSKHT